VTYTQARRKAARLTRAGVPTMVIVNGSRAGGYQTKTTASRRAASSRYQRKARYGASPEDVARLLAAQTGPDGIARCPLTLMEVTAKSALDHAHGEYGPDALRGILRPHVNGVIGGNGRGALRLRGARQPVRRPAARGPPSTSLPPRLIVSGALVLPRPAPRIHLTQAVLP